MKQLLFLLVCGLSFSGGCQSSGGSKDGVEVIIDGGGRFPESLIGRWKADKNGWEFVFEPDGTISSAAISLGRVKIEPGKVTTMPMKLGGKGIFKPGEWTVHYSPESRELVVEIVIDHFRAELGDDVIYGQTRDFFIGSVSEDNELWLADHFSFPEYIVDTNKYHNYKLDVDPNGASPEELIFQKETKLK